MFPLRDTIQSRTYPVVNTALIVANVLVFFIEWAQGKNLSRFLFLYGLVPVRYSVPQISQYFDTWQQIFPFFSFMFLHGGFWHLFGNMWSLYIFGDNVEDRLGPIRYLFFYILCGVGSGLSHLLINWHSQVPTIGASGAIAGVMGAYFVLYPRSRILTFIPIFFIPYFIEIPAFFFLGIWFFLQFISAAGTPAHGGGIAWWAHIGGFLLGIVFLKFFLKTPELGLSNWLRQKTSKQKTHRLQVIRTAGRSGDSNLYGSISITPMEARLGTRKLVNIPWGFHKRLFLVHIPPGVRDGTLLRLAGMGRPIDPQRKGDLYLRVNIQDER
ncbi:MAG: rhomboid family intramembrane serine protease [Deltaproteobacteria bacterium]|nr:MAG: rhomboid family intramembrane serine protease [Deltaproteobacteria bacterium]